MNKERSKRKKFTDSVKNMNHNRFHKRRQTQQNIKRCPLKDKYSDFGEMDYICQYCNASFWSIEYSKKSCCHNGKVKLPPLSDYPNDFKTLLYDDKKFRELIRYYNNVFSFATFKAKIINNFGPGIYNLKIQGQVCHIASNSIKSIDETSPKGQIYLYDDLENIDTILNENENLVEEHTKIISQVLQNNPYTKKLKNLYELTKSQKLKEYHLYFTRNINLDKNRYNKPSTAQCAALIVSKDGEIPLDYDLCVYPKNPPKEIGPTSILNKLSFHIDPMIFPIIFPYGDIGWNPMFKQNDNNDKNLSPLQYYSYRLAYRPMSKFSPILYCGRLTQQYIIQAYIIIEYCRLNFLRYNQKKLRVECYQGLVDHVKKSAMNKNKNFENERLGNLFILPSTYIGSPRYMHKSFLDSMAIMRKIGSPPDVFVTVTTNPNWPELKRELKKFPPGTSCNDIAIITVRLFYAKLRSILADILSGNIFGKIIAHVYVFEFQKRGLPHAHLLLVLDHKSKLTNPDKIDEHISAEIPDDNDKELQELVFKHMLHGPHSEKTLCYDVVNKTCSKKFPKAFCDATQFERNGFPRYRRRNNKNKNYVYNKRLNGKPIKVDNSMVVPYNPTLLRKYNCHINVEYCASIMSIKYLYKYLHKGHDRAHITVDKNGEDKVIYDEITEHMDCRYVGPMEAAWRIQKYPFSVHSHSVIVLGLHLPFQQPIIFDENNIDIDSLNHETTLTAYFKLNSIDDYAKNFLYCEIPEHYSFTKKKWIRRKNHSNTLGRLICVIPSERELFHLKLILHRVKGATSFDDLKNHENKTYSTFTETAIAMGLIENDEEIFHIFDEACTIMLPKQLRLFFAWFLIANKLPLAQAVWEKCKNFFCEDFVDNAENQALQHIEEILDGENYKCSDFGLPEPILNLNKTNEPLESTIDDYKKTFTELYTKLNNDQKYIFDYITKSPEEKMIFIDGPGGTGKTFLYNTLIYHYLSQRKQILSMAWTGIASILLPGGMTSHKTFKLPLDLQDIKTANLKHLSDKKKIRECEIIIWDEASMIPKKALEIVDNTIRDCCKLENIPFAGKLIILGGDFRQTLPVIRYGTKFNVIQESIKNSDLWINFKVLRLKTNMRSENDDFSSFLLKIGDGKIDDFEIPDAWKSNDICKKIYGSNISVNDDLSNKIILSPHNEDIYKINEKILKKINSEIHIYYSIDYARHKGEDQTDVNAEYKYPTEYLNSLRFPGFPVHKLSLKIGTIVMLIRNLSMNDGLCNGTRLKVLELYKYNIKAEIITGDKKGNIAFIPRIILDTGEYTSLPFILFRRQFPIILAFAMTINKSQGQSFEMVGIYIHRPLFSHGQLYVALSRCKNPKKLFIQNKTDDCNIIKNIVWKEIFKL